jgi:hypothetical protein
MAATLYGARGASALTSDLYTIDPITAATTSVGPIGYAITGLAFDPTDGTLYGCTSKNSAADPKSIITIDILTGVGTLIGAIGLGTDDCADICFDEAGQMYGWLANSGDLCSVDKATGAATPIGPATTFGGALDFVLGTLYHLPHNTTGDIATVDPLTGDQTFGAAMDGGGGVINSGSYRTETGRFYTTNSNTDLATVDLNTGEITVIGGGLAPATFDGIAWTPSSPPPPFTGRVFADLPVRTFITDIDSRTLSILDRRATDRQFLFTLNQPAYHTAQVASDDNEINIPFPDADSPANLTNNRRLIFALQRWQGYDPPYQPIFGGIIMTPEDQGADTPTTRYTAYDGWQYMMSRPVRDPATGDLAGIDGLKFAAGSLASDIALGLLQITEITDGETHIDWSDSGLIEASVPLDNGITFDQGLSLGEAWQQLCATGTIDIHLLPMYEPIDAPGKINRFQVVAQTAGTAAGPVRYNIVMGWDKGGRSLMGINRLVDGTRLANEVQFFAGQGGVPVPLQSDAASITANGEYWAQQFFPGTHDRTLVALLAVTELAIRRNGARSISLDPAPERVETPLRDWGLGDYLPVWASRNLREPLGIDYDAFDPDNPGASGYQRVYAIPMAVDNNGVARVTGVLTSKEN